MIGNLGRALAVGIVLVASVAEAQVTRGVSTGSMPQAVGGDSAMPSISREGRWVTFESAATNLVADDLNGARDVFLVDRLTNDIRLISRGPGGVVGNAASYAAAISGNGAVVAFVSEASNLVPGSAGSGVYLYDRATSQTSRVPLAAGVRADTHEGLRRLISLSADGRFIAFGAHEEPATAYPFVMLFDRVQGSLTKFAIGPTIGAYGLHPRLNAAGNLLAVEFYELQTKGGMPLTTIATRSRFVRVIDLANSAAQDLFPPAPWSGVDCGFPSISDSGRWVTYECRNVPDPSPSRFARIYLHDRVANTSIEISTPPTGVTRRHSLAPEISADGRFVAFTSFTPLVSGVTGEPGQVYRYDRNTGAIELVSKDLFGVPFFRGAFAVALDATGTLVALTTPEPVDPSDTNLRADVYLVDPSCQYAVSPAKAAFPPGGGQLSVAVATGPGCIWRSGPGIQGFFGVGLPGGGTGPGTQTLTAAANVSGALRTGTVSVAGQTMTVSQNPSVPPAITTQPADASVAVGTSAVFRVAASGDPAATYRWQMSADGNAWYDVPLTTPYSGATSPQLTVENPTPAPFWNRFRAIATNVAGTATSSAARLTVVGSCSYSSVVGEFVLPPGGGSGYIDLVTGPTCPWTTGSSAAWLAVLPANGVSSGRIAYSAPANTTGAMRSATMSVAGRTNIIRQAPAASAMVITTTTLPSTTVGAAYAATLAATGAVGAIAWSVDSGLLPAGLSLSSAGTFSGMATSPGTATFTVRATDSASVTTTRTLSIVVVAPSAPVLAPAVVNRPNLTLVWTPPLEGPAPSAYTVVASLAAGGPLVAQLPVGQQNTITVAAPDGTFFIRVLATVNGGSVTSNEIRVDIAPPALPSPPENLMAAIAGGVITFAWQAPSGSAVTGYVLEAGSGLGLSNLAILPLGDVTTFVTPPVPNGSYYVRLRGQNASGTGPPSNEVRVVVGPPPPSAPTLTGSGSLGGNVVLSWSTPSSGAAVTGYELHAGTAPGLSNIVVIPLPASQELLATSGVPPGTYYVRVVATSAQGLGEVSNEVALVVP